MPEQFSDRELVEILKVYAEAGVDCAVSETAVDWLNHGPEAPGAEIRGRLKQASGADATTDASLKRQAAPQQRTKSPRPSAQAPTPTRTSRTNAPPPAQQVETAPGAAEARKLAQQASSLPELRAGLENFNGCALKATAKNLCFFRGAEKSQLMVIGEAPGRDEDIAGKPFVGRAGQLLDQMLSAIGLTEENVHITNVVYWRPPGNRTPTLQETQACRPFLERQAQFVEPEFVLLLGGAAAKNILDVTDGIMRLRGKWRDIQLGGRQVRALPTLHPAYLLRTPAAKRQAWRDLLALKKALNG
ncbi:MAG: uracil-DNA glycosylase family protein [Filomicrobium sp.]